MFGFLEAITKQVTNHTTGLGAVWYILTLGFRVGVLSTVGGAIYGDEQGSFTCSNGIAGCTSQCYNQYAKLAAMRLWSFQMLFELMPALLFHLFVMYTRSQIAKIEAAKEALRKRQEDPTTEQSKKELVWLEKRIREVGEYEMRTVARGTEAVVVPHSNKIVFANIVQLVLRLTVSIIGIYWSAVIFNIQDGGYRNHPLGLKQLFWNEVNGKYICKVYEADPFHRDPVYKACFAHVDDSAGFVPCFVSRPYEKTVLLRYMNLTSLFCVFLTLYEIVAVINRAVRQRRERKSLENAIALRRMRSPVTRSERASEGMEVLLVPRRDVRRHGNRRDDAMSTTSSSTDLYEARSTRSATTRGYQESPRRAPPAAKAVRNESFGSERGRVRTNDYV